MYYKSYLILLSGEFTEIINLEHVGMIIVMVFNATFNNISVLSWRSVYWWRKPEGPEKTTDLLRVTDKFIT
jgi:hypothetical protein